MTGATMSGPQDIACRLELPPLLGRFAAAPKREALASALASRIAAMAASLGLEARATCGIVGGQRRRAQELDDIRLTVGDRRCRFTRMHLLRSVACARGELLDDTAAGDIARWLGEAGDSMAQAFIGHLVFLAIARDPSVLSDAALQDADHRRRRVARALQAQGISIAGLAADAGLIAALQDSDTAIEAVAEAAIAAGRPACVEIHLTRADLRGMTSDATDDERKQFRLLREGLYFRSGLRVPALRLVENEALAPRAFAFRINDLLGLPWPGLAAGEILVEADAELAGAAIQGAVRAAAHPLLDVGCAVLPAAAAARATELGWNVRRPLDYLAACLAYELRSLAPRLFDRELVASELGRLAESAPALVRCVNDRVGNDRVAAVLRELAAEGVSVLDLRGLLTGLVDFDTVVGDRAEAAIVDDRVVVARPIGDPPPIELLTAVARKASRRTIVTTLCSTGNTLNATRVHPAIVATLLARDGTGPVDLDEAWCDRLLDCVATRAPTAGLQVPARCLLASSAEARHALRALVSQELPQLTVLSLEEVAAGTQWNADDFIAPEHLDAAAPGDAAP
jgi:type III secretory pathway component EscV